LRQLLCHLRGKVIVVLDRGGMHHGPEIRQLLQDYPRLSLEALPAYAPELNPVEHLWNHIKYVKLANFTPNSVTELNGRMHHHLSQTQEHRERLESFVRSSGLSFPRRKLLK
jgi:putative transposase